MNFLRRFYQQKTERPGSYSLVDIGRDTVKVAVILLTPGAPEPQVVGYGLAETGGHDITGGRLEAAAVTDSVNTALILAEDSTEAVVGQKIVPDHVIFALAGRATVGKLFTVRQTRSSPTLPVSVKELNQLRTRAERLVRQGLVQLPVEGGRWRALAFNDAGLRLDEHLVLEGVGLTGYEMSLSVFGVAGHAGAWRALEVLADRLDLLIANIIAAPQALASIVPYSEAVVLDTGESGTTVCLIRDDSLVATGWLPFGGGYFTQALAQAADIDADRAKELQYALTNGKLDQSEAVDLNACLEYARERWYQAVIEMLVELSAEQLLPWKICLTGRGNLLPGLDKLLKSDPTPFQRAPEISRLGPRPPTDIKDLTDGLDYDLFSLALSLTVGLPEL